jgi:hypothetical protein
MKYQVRDKKDCCKVLGWLEISGGIKGKHVVVPRAQGGPLRLEVDEFRVATKRMKKNPNLITMYLLPKIPVYRTGIAIKADSTTLRQLRRIPGFKEA